MNPPPFAHTSLAIIIIISGMKSSRNGKTGIIIIAEETMTCNKDELLLAGRYKCIFLEAFNTVLWELPSEMDGPFSARWSWPFKWVCK